MNEKGAVARPFPGPAAKKDYFKALSVIAVV
jgi:hypothetical protein